MPFIGIPPFGQTVRTVTTITATASQTTFTPTGGYTVGYCDVYYNGIKLVAGSDFTATDGLTVVLTTGATSGAVVEIITYGSVTITDAVRRSGDTFAGAVAINSTLAAGNTTITGTLSATANVNFDTGTLFVDGTNNRVGINNTAPTSALTVTGNAAFSNTVVITGAATFSNTAAFTGPVTFSNTTTTIFVSNTSVGNVVGLNAASQFGAARFGTFNNYPAIGDGSNWQLYCDTNNSYVQLTGSMGGIRFPGTQVASSDANTLDDYEEGTWTPALMTGSTQPTFTYTNRGGTYVKIGRQVIAWFYALVSVSSAGNAQAAVVASSLPFAPRSNSLTDSAGSRGGFVTQNPQSLNNVALTWNSANPSTADVLYFTTLTGGSTTSGLASGTYAGYVIYEAT